MSRKRYPHAPRVTVDVDAATIAASIPRDSSHCMIAEAIKASIPGATRISVDLQSIRFSDPAKRLRYVYLTPRAAQVALIRFDGGHPPEPFSMRLQGGQVTAMSPAGRKEPAEDRERRVVRQRELRQAELLATQALVSEGTGVPPARVGGRRPPLMTFARRRTYGLRALERLDPQGVATITS